MLTFAPRPSPCAVGSRLYPTQPPPAPRPSAQPALCRRAPLTAPLSLVVQGGGLYIAYIYNADVTITGTSIYANAATDHVRHSPAPPTRCPPPR